MFSGPQKKRGGNRPGLETILQAAGHSGRLLRAHPRALNPPMLRGPRRTVQAPHPELAEVQVELFCTVGRLSTSVRNRGSYQGHSVVDFPAVKWLNPLKVQVRPLLPDQTAFLGFEVPQKNTCIPAISKVVQWLWSSLARTRLPRFELSSQFLQGTHFAIQGLGASHRNTDSQTSDILLYLSKVSKVHRMVVVEPAGNDSSMGRRRRSARPSLRH